MTRERIHPRTLFEFEGEATLWDSEGGHAPPSLEVDGEDITSFLEDYMAVNVEGRYQLRVRVEIIEDRGAGQ